METAILKKVIDSNDMTVGGGSASAIAGAMAAGMVSMVAKLSLKKPVELTEDDYIKISQEADALAAQLLDGANRDAEAYLLITRAFKMPKESDEDKAERSKAINAAAIKAAEVPRDNSFGCRRVYELANSLVNKSNPACSSDLMSAVFLSHSGIKGACLNIEANLPLIKDAAALEGFHANISELRVYF